MTDEWIQTYSKNVFFFQDPHNEKSSIRLFDIALSLSRIPRFNGHSSQFISIAEHSIAVGRIYEHLYTGSPAELLVATLHDAHEAYLGDMTRPFIRYLMAEHGFSMETVKRHVQLRIHSALGVPEEAELLGRIARADLHALETERRLYCDSSLDWCLDIGEPVADYSDLYGPLNADEACQAFMNICIELKQRR